MDFFQRYKTLQLERENSDELIKDLLIYCKGVEDTLGEQNARLLTELKDAQLDLEDARRSRRDLQQQLTHAAQMVALCDADRETMRARNPYIQVLIDGDGMIFNEQLVRQGIDGGKQAATALRNVVLEHYGEFTEGIEVMAKVFTNASGLARAMLRDESLDSVDTFKDFTIGFTQGRASFEFVDVGPGKERADSKIRETMRWHLRNYNCKQILLGISHDAGYAPFLDEVVTADDRSRIAIIEGFPVVRELSATGLPILNFDRLFRREKLADRTQSNSTTGARSTWAAVTSTIPPVSIANNGIAIKRSSPAPTPTWEPGRRGLDAPIMVNAVALDKVKRRTNNNKLCNNHYLRGPCAKGNECSFEHDHKATDDDLKAIAYLTRFHPCVSGQDCDQEYCIYGHHCPTATYSRKDNEWQCSAFGCRFSKDEHPPNTVIRHPRKDQRFGGEYFERF